MFQTQINNQPAPAEAGDFAGVNPRASVLGSPGMYSAPADGLIVGRFAWVDPTTGTVSQSYVSGYQIGFLHRENNAVITEFLGESVFTVYEGLPITLFDQGDFWGLFAGGAQPGDLVWANPGNGSLIAAATAPETDSFTAEAGFGGTVIVGAEFDIAIASNIATVTNAVGWVDEGTIVTSSGITAEALGARLTGTEGGNGTFELTHGNVAEEAATGENQTLTVSAVAQGALEVGNVVNTTDDDDYTIAAFLGAADGGVGSYEFAEAAAYEDADAATAPTTVLEVTAVGSGTIEPGDPVESSSAEAGTQIVEQLTGTAGGVGTYRISVLNYFTSEAASVNAVATPWIVNSVADVGELAKISTWG